MSQSFQYQEDRFDFGYRTNTGLFSMWSQVGNSKSLFCLQKQVLEEPDWKPHWQQIIASDITKCISTQPEGRGQPNQVKKTTCWPWKFFLRDQNLFIPLKTPNFAENSLVLKKKIKIIKTAPVAFSTSTIMLQECLVTLKSK